MSDIGSSIAGGVGVGLVGAGVGLSGVRAMRTMDELGEASANKRYARIIDEHVGIADKAGANFDPRSLQTASNKVFADSPRNAAPAAFLSSASRKPAAEAIADLRRVAKTFHSTEIASRSLAASHARVGVGMLAVATAGVLLTSISGVLEPSARR